MPAVGPEPPDRSHGVDSRGVERGEVGQGVGFQRGESDGENAVAEGEGRHEESAQGGGEGDLQGEGQVVEGRLLFLLLSLLRGLLQVVGVDITDHGDGDAQGGENVQQDTVEPVPNAGGPGLLRVSDVGGGPGEAGASHGEFELEGPTRAVGP